MSHYYSFILILFEVIYLWEDAHASNAQDLWPSNSYALPKPKSGCPENNDNIWKESWLKQDVEDDFLNKNQTSNFSSVFHMDAVLTNDYLTRKFCMKQYRANPWVTWPKGSYCYYKTSSWCPSSMSDGYIYWDDEDQNNGNKRSHNFPSWDYTENTKIYYCCRDDGDWYNSIILPTYKPFYLLPYNSANCQRVKWALSSLEYIIYDTEDNNNGDGFANEHVFTDERKSLPKIYYCYYEGCQQKITQSSGHLSSSQLGENYPDFQYCSWLITVNITSVISLKFNVLHIQDCSENFIDIFDGQDESSQLLARFCGDNATTKNIEIVSPRNYLFLVLKSGNNTFNGNNVPKFDANFESKDRAKGWPYGKYVLPKTKYGCPTSTWQHQWIDQDMENNDPKSSFSSHFHMEAMIKQGDINQSFCVKTDMDTYPLLWPEGSYCIYRYKYCPTGFEKGSIFLDHEDSNPRKHDSGTTSWMAYSTSYIVYYFCCQDKGHWSNSIKLPIEIPFFLLPYKSRNCQRIQWMTSSLEYIVYDTEENNYDEFYPSYPYVDKSVKGLPKMFYCFYQSCRHELNETSGSFSFSSSNYGLVQDFHQCSWIITVPEGFFITITFHNLTFPDCDLYIYDGDSDPVKILSEEIISTTNKTQIVLQNNNTTTSTKEIFFYAEYTAMLPPTPAITVHPSTQRQRHNVTGEPEPNLTTATGNMDFQNNNDDNGTSLVAIIVPIFTIIIIIAIVIFIVLFMKRRKKIPQRNEEMNVTYDANFNLGLREPNNYETPGVIINSSTVEKQSSEETDNPLYEPASSNNVVYQSADNACYDGVNVVDYEEVRHRVIGKEKVDDNIYQAI